MTQFVSGSVLTASSLNTAFNTATIATATTNYTVGSANAGELVLLNSASAGTVTIPLDATYSFPVGSIVGLYNSGSATWTVATAGTAATVSGSATTLAQYSSATLLKTAANTWYIAQGGGGSIPKASVSGGTSSSYTSGGITYAVNTFTASGTLTVANSGVVAAVAAVQHGVPTQKQAAAAGLAATSTTPPYI